MGDKKLNDITNPRLFRLKQRVAMWSFNIHHLPENTNWAADATSRTPVNAAPMDEEELVEASLAAISCAPIAITYTRIIGR